MSTVASRPRSPLEVSYRRVQCPLGITVDSKANSTTLTFTSASGNRQPLQLLLTDIVDPNCLITYTSRENLILSIKFWKPSV